ncbi:MAG: hypothetical protein HY460_00005 [Parcubacteria group bacterium]|nr:hypothetical protein [Parcubacteria group bacterium]
MHFQEFAAYVIRYLAASIETARQHFEPTDAEDDIGSREWIVKYEGTLRLGFRYCDPFAHPFMALTMLAYELARTARLIGYVVFFRKPIVYTSEITDLLNRQSQELKVYNDWLEGVIRAHHRTAAIHSPAP